jgi:hypothetical protein
LYQFSVCRYLFSVHNGEGPGASKDGSQSFSKGDTEDGDVKTDIVRRVSHPLVLARFGDRDVAATAARAVRELGVERADLSIVARTRDDEGMLARAVGGTPGVEIEDSRLGWLLGELSGHILAAIAIVMPGIGPILTAGPLAADLGEAVGHATGSLSATLEKAGFSRAQASRWQTHIEQGMVLLGVHAKPETSLRVRQALEDAGADEVTMATWTGD